jgi:hypothetical protein
MKTDKNIRDYLAFIGSIGGSTSRRELSRKQARQMVAIREAKRAAIRKGKIEWALKRIPLPKEAIKLAPQWPAVRRPRLIGNVMPY